MAKLETGNDPGWEFVEQIYCKLEALHLEVAALRDALSDKGIVTQPKTCDHIYVDDGFVGTVRCLRCGRIMEHGKEILAKDPRKDSRCKHPSWSILQNSMQKKCNYCGEVQDLDVYSG